jgi:hypothetical protein
MLIKHETELLAKEKGYTDTHTDRGVITVTRRHNTLYTDGTDWIERFPTQAELHKWLIEQHGQYICVIPTVTANWTFKTIGVLYHVDFDVMSGLKDVSDLPPYKEVNKYDYSTYEQALEAGLIEVLKQIKL